MLPSICGLLWYVVCSCLVGRRAPVEATHSFSDAQVWGHNEDDSTCKKDAEKSKNAGICPQSCQDDITCMIAACSDCALVDIVCDEQIDTTAYPKLKTSQGLAYDDLDLADVPADKKAQAPYGDSGLFDVMNTWGPELSGNQNLRRVRAESSRRCPRHRCDVCSMAWRCRFLAACPGQVGRVIAEK